jgi:hypothetical protein
MIWFSIALVLFGLYISGPGFASKAGGPPLTAEKKKEIAALNDQTRQRYYP